MRGAQVALKVLFGSIVASVLLATLLGSCARGQEVQPDRRGEVRIDKPAWKGEKANAPVPPEFHTPNRNPGVPGWGGCVPSSVRTAALYHGVPKAQVEAFWALAKRRIGVGGTDPNTLESLLKETMPDEKYYSHLGTDPTILDQLSRRGVCMGATMGWGQGYGGAINHMVNLIHYRTGGYAMVVDNNDVGKYHVMPATEYAARWTKNGRETGWVFCFTRPVAMAVKLGGSIVYIVPVVGLAWGAGFLLLGGAMTLRRTVAR